MLTSIHEKNPFSLILRNATNFLARNEAPCEIRDLNYFRVFFFFLVLFILIFTVNLVKAYANTAKPMDFCILLHWNLTETILHYRRYLILHLSVFIALNSHLINMRIELLSLGQITMWWSKNQFLVECKFYFRILHEILIAFEVFIFILLKKCWL